MNVLFLSDTQIGAGKNLAPDRLADQEQGLTEIGDLADAYDVALVVHCGDVFDSRHPDEESRMVFKRFARRISAERDFVVVAGNHDLRNAAVASAVDLYDECEFVREPKVLQYSGLDLALLPWTPPGRMVASQNGGDRDALHAVIAERLVEIARGLRQQCGSPAILALHWWIEGATTATGYGANGVILEPVIPLLDVEELGFDAVIAGHVHNPEPLSLVPPVMYCGSPMICDWGETEIPHGVRLLDTETMEHRFIEIPDRRFVTVDVDLIPTVSGDGHARLPDGDDLLPNIFNDPDYESDAIASRIAEHFPLTDAVVRIRYKATAEQARRIDLGAIRQLVADAGASKLFAVQPDIVRSDRARVEGVDESLDEREAVRIWLDRAEVARSQREPFEELFIRYLDEVRS